MQNIIYQKYSNNVTDYLCLHGSNHSKCPARSILLNESNFHKTVQKFSTTSYYPEECHLDLLEYGTVQKWVIPEKGLHES